MIFRRCFFFRRRIISVSLDSRVAFHSRLATRLFTRDAFLILAPKYRCDTFLFINFEKSLPPNCSRYRKYFASRLLRSHRTRFSSRYFSSIVSVFSQLDLSCRFTRDSSNLTTPLSRRNNKKFNLSQFSTNFYLLIFNLGWNKIQEILKAPSSSKQLQSINQYNNNSLLIS